MIDYVLALESYNAHAGYKPRHAERQDFPLWEIELLSSDDALVNRIGRVSELYKKLGLSATHRAEN